MKFSSFLTVVLTLTILGSFSYADQGYGTLSCTYPAQDQNGQVITAPLFNPFVMREDFTSFGNETMCSQGCFEGPIGWHYRLNLQANTVTLSIYNTSEYSRLYTQGGLVNEPATTDYMDYKTVSVDELATNGVDLVIRKLHVNCKTSR